MAKRPSLRRGAGMQQANQQIQVLAAPSAETGVEAIDPINIRAPDRKIAGTRAPPMSSPELSQGSERQPQHARKPVDATALAVAQPAGEVPRFRVQPLAQHGSGQCRRKEHAVPGDEPSRLGQLAMCRNEVGRREAVAVEKNAIVALAGEQGAVAISAARNPQFFCQTWPSATPSRGRHRSTSSAVPEQDPSSAITTSKPRSPWRDKAPQPEHDAFICGDDDGDQIRHVATAPDFHSARPAAL